ncbi:MAG: hypothetical protein JXA11_05925 [Phycisphaerae bacterium]|nr:hypothetical protein [Phycisphaerae bacterium]
MSSFRFVGKRFFPWGLFVLLGLVCLLAGFSCGKGASKSEASQERAPSPKKQKPQMTAAERQRIERLKVDRVKKEREEQRKQQPSPYYPTPLQLAGTYDASRLTQRLQNNTEIKELKLTNLDGTLAVEKVMWVKTHSNINENTVFIWERSGKQVMTYENKHSSEIHNKPGQYIVNDRGSTIATDRQILLYKGFQYYTNRDGTKPTWEMKFNMSHPLLRSIPKEEGVFRKQEGAEYWMTEIIFFIPVINTHSGTLPKDAKITDNSSVIDFNYLYPEIHPDPPARGTSQCGDCINVHDPRWTGPIYDMRIKRYMDTQGRSVGYQIHTSQIVKKIRIQITPDGQLIYRIF